LRAQRTTADQPGRRDALALAVSLDEAVNGTSLVLLFQCGDASLLFTGDAQWGTWDRIFADPAKRELVASATLLKVGHHGSHNATPRRLVERVMRGLEVALVSVAPTSIPTWSDIPRQPLLNAIAERKTTVIRSDKSNELTVLEGVAWRASVEPGGLWIEVEVPVRRRTKR
jgi:beta-lactamase superfamily II metal-dependent hydrolase